MRPGEDGPDAQGTGTPTGTFAAASGEDAEVIEEAEAVPSPAEPRAGFVRRVRESGGLVLLVGGVAVPALVAGGIAMAVHRGGEEKVVPKTTKPVVSSPVPRPRPLVYPTYGEYVPPRPVEKVTRRPPTATSTRATPTPSARPSCPPGWEQNPWLRRWCWQHGFSTNDS